MPAANERALEKAKSLPADSIIFDLEDAVAPDAKESARVAACAAAGSGAVRPARVDHPLQRPRHALGRGGSGGDRGLDRGSRGCTKGQFRRLPRRRVAAARRRRCACRDVRVGDDRNTNGDLRRAGDRRAPTRLGAGDGDQRSRPRTAGAVEAPVVERSAPPPGHGVAGRTRGRQGDPRRCVQRREGPRRLRRRMRARRRIGIRRKDADSPRAGRHRQPGAGHHRRPRSNRRGGSSPRSMRRSPTAAAW